MRADPKTVRLASPERIIVEEEPESEQPLLVRAVEDLVSFAEEISRRPPVGE